MQEKLIQKMPGYWRPKTVKQQSGVYKILCFSNDRAYIGKSQKCGKRMVDHFYELKKGNHRNSYLQRAYNKYGASNFSFEVIEYCEFGQMQMLEAYWIEEYKVLNPKYGFNLVDDKADSSRIHAAETKKKISEASKSHWEGNDKRKKEASERTKKMYEDDPKRREEQSKVSKERRNDPAYAKLMSEISKARWLIPGYKEKRKKTYSENWKNNEKAQSEHLERQRKPVVVYDKDGVEVYRFKSILEAKTELGLGKNTIGRYLSGKSKPRNGYVWKYLPK